jgi:transcriptional regulator with XRE-family HTH domain
MRRKLITKLRTDKGWSKRELGAHSDVHPARVGQIENDRVRPYPPELGRLARALGWQGEPEQLIEEVMQLPFTIAATYDESGRTKQDAHFIAHARQDIPDLVRDLREARELLREARELLGCETSCGVPCPVDGCDDGCANHLFLAKTASREEGDSGQK